MSDETEREMPADFEIPITDDGQVLRWEGSFPDVDGKYEFGLRPGRDQRSIDLATAAMRKYVWWMHENARVGHHHLNAHAHVARHLAQRPKAVV